MMILKETGMAEVRALNLGCGEEIWRQRSFFLQAVMDNVENEIGAEVSAVSHDWLARPL